MSDRVIHQTGHRETEPLRMRTLLICHESAHLDRDGMARWLASFSDLVGIVALRETKQRMWRRIRREVNRIGIMRFPDVLAFRFYYSLFLASQDRRWQEEKLAELRRTYPLIGDVPVLHTHSPNAPEAEAFIRESGPDIMIARCKTLLRENVFSLPSIGTFVMHPGICPEYRNAHGCFWALANGEPDKVGMTLLRIDRGVDTGPVYGYYYYQGDAATDSHVVIQHRVVFDHLKELEQKLAEIYAGSAMPLDTTGRTTATWGQPWLTKYWDWKLRMRRTKNASNYAHVSRRG